MLSDDAVISPGNALIALAFLLVKAATALFSFSHRNSACPSVRPSVCHESRTTLLVYTALKHRYLFTSTKTPKSYVI